MKESAQPTGRKAPSVLLAMSQSERREQLRELILGRAPGTRVEMVCNALDALMLLARRSTDLLVLDRAMDGAAVATLLRQMAHISPATRVMLCDDRLASATDSATEVLLWSEAPECLQHWIDTWTSARSIEESQK